MQTNNLSFAAHYFDGLISTAHTVEVSLEGNLVLINGTDIFRRYPVKNLTLSPAVGSAKALVFLQDGAELHIADSPEYDAFVRQLQPQSFLQVARFFETHWRYALLGLVFSVAFIFAGLRFGLPALATFVANRLPAGFEAKIGDESLQLLDQWLMKPSQLSTARQQLLSKQLVALCNKHPCPRYRLHFRNSRIGPNAFALPAGDIVVTDALVNIAQNDEEVLSVVFHELGHVQYRHTLRLAIQSAGAAALLVGVTGDLSSLSDMAAGLPTLLMQNGYQRDMEREADAHALTMLKASCIAPKRFADILQRISVTAESQKGQRKDFVSLLSSHPDTDSRIVAFQSTDHCH